MSTRTAQGAVGAALDVLGRASADWRNPDVGVHGGVHWPVAVNLARRELRRALKALQPVPLERRAG